MVPLHNFFASVFRASNFQPYFLAMALVPLVENGSENPGSVNCFVESESCSRSVSLPKV